ncbi:MAG TPA: hypothetical protein VGO06_00575 [Bosea sp. (in: a-proteobacteria)]|jgi:hypothetical protein|uniref:hypothetical protein n=1 Tax=Bosea sp. (in: a-proteobacteria) TaxID=1871050 RepID=UPI002E144E1A|nr:hypothetical protein [Bosea sp. (in: a-proteobacteria)]
MALHPEIFSMMIAGSMTGMIQSAAQHAVDRRDEAVLAAWDHELASARGDANAMGHLAAEAIRQLAESEGENANLRDEVARLRALLASRNQLIREITR